MLIIIILLVKLGLFWIPYHYGQLTYADHMALRAYENVQMAHKYNLFVNTDFDHFVTVETPKYMVAGNTYPISYKLVWGKIPVDGLTYQLKSSPEAGGIDDEIEFDPLNIILEKNITLSSSIPGKEPFKASFTGTLKNGENELLSELSENDAVWIIPMEVKEELEANRLKNGIITAISLIVVILIFVFVW